MCHCSLVQTQNPVTTLPGPPLANPSYIAATNPPGANPITADIIVKCKPGNAIDGSEDWDPRAITVVEAAARIWAQTLTSSVPIVIHAFLSNEQPAYATTSPKENVNGNMFTATPEPLANVWYPIALANKLAGIDLNGSEIEIVMTFISNKKLMELRGEEYYYGLDGQGQSHQVDFLTLALHEMAHGFIGGSSAQFVNNLGFLGGSSYNHPLFYNIYDYFLALCSSKTRLVEASIYDNNSIELGIFFTGQLGDDVLCWMGPNGEGCGPEMNEYPIIQVNHFVPPTPRLQIGADIAHLSELNYPTGDANSLMTPILDLVNSYMI